MILDCFNDLNWAAVVVATIAAFAVGLVWFAPPVLGGLWAKQVSSYAGIPEDDVTSGAARPPVLAAWLVTIAVNVVVLALAAHATGVDSWGDGAVLGLVLGLGFAVTTGSWPTIFARLPRTWWLINGGAALVMNAVAGAILGAWQ